LILENEITGNYQYGCSGGGGGGGILIGGAASAEIVGNFIARNNGGDGIGGGAISLFAAGTPRIFRNLIMDNTVLTTGGAISMYNQSDAVVVENLILGNQAPQGGGIYYLVPSGANGPVLVNNTFAENTSSTGQGSAVYANDYNLPSQLFNNIIVGVPDQTAVYCGNLNSSTTPDFTSNDIFAANGITYGGICSDQTGMNGNISADPKFGNPAKRNYRLRAISPAINAGTNSTPDIPKYDFAGHPRIVGGTIDIGAYEYQGK